MKNPKRILLIFLAVFSGLVLSLAVTKSTCAQSDDNVCQPDNVCTDCALPAPCSSCTPGRACQKCLPGLPCVVLYEENDPFDPEDGPNILGRNRNKVDEGMESCDADFMNQIYARAFLEAERENVMNEHLIRKPDSILEYTCFDKQLNASAARAGPLFTESDHWHAGESEEGTAEPVRIEIDGALGDPVTGMTPVPDVEIDVFMGEDKLDYTLDKLILKALKTHISNNFGHDFLGGYAEGFDSTQINEVTGGGFGCDYMYSIYYLSKCDDMVTDEEFWTFNWLADNDPRQLPEPCENGTQITKDLIKLAENKGGKYAFFDTIEYVDKPDQLTFVDFMDPKECQDPVPTGLKVVKEEKTFDLLGNVTVTETIEYDEKTCINPGCYYDQPNDECKPNPQDN